jgi:hypothetical protein
MRGELREPAIDENRLQAATRLAREIYVKHEAGRQYQDLLTSLSDIVSVPVTKADASGAFGSVDAETWARDLFLVQRTPPADLSDSELIEVLRAICAAEGEEWQISWWLRCVEASTGCAEVIDLIYYPSDVLGPEDGRQDLTPAEILAEAKRRPRRVLVTPPPRSGAA